MALTLNNSKGVSINLSKLQKAQRGQRINLSKESDLKNVLIKIVWEGADLDASIVQLNSNDTFVRKDDQTSMVFYHNLEAKGIVHQGDVKGGGTEEAVINLEAVDPNVNSLIFVASSHAETEAEKTTFGVVRNAKAFLINADTNEALYEFDLEEDHSTATAVEMARLYRKDSTWRFTSLEEDVSTHYMGLQGIVDKYNK